MEKWIKMALDFSLSKEDTSIKVILRMGKRMEEGRSFIKIKTRMMDNGIKDKSMDLESLLKLKLIKFKKDFGKMVNFVLKFQRKTVFSIIFLLERNIN